MKTCYVNNKFLTHILIQYVYDLIEVNVVYIIAITANYIYDTGLYHTVFTNFIIWLH